MHQPRPYGLAVQGGELSEEDSSAVDALARRLTNIKQLGNMDSLRMVRALPDGGYAVAQDMGGVFKVITFKPGDVPPSAVPSDGLAKAFLPMLFSGVVIRDKLRDGEGVGLLLTKSTCLRIAGYSSEAQPSPTQYLQRFRIGYHPMVQEFEPSQPGALAHTQYTLQRPTWYSGSMALMLQVLAGYGRQDLADLPDSPVERARMQLPERVRRDVERELINVRLPGYSGLPPKDGRMGFDYKFNSTHGCAFDTEGKPWLLRVSSRGVYAMPLPIIPATATQAFHEFVAEKQDDELLAVLARFGAMPSGEGFPSSESAFEAWRRAGVIIRICDTADFYSHLAYNASCGWSFSESGREGVNTCYDYDEAEGLAYGLTYMLRLHMAPAAFDGRLPPDTQRESQAEQALLNQYLSGLFSATSGDGAEDLAVRYKLRRSGGDALLARAMQQPDGAQEAEYWRNLEMEPIAQHSGSCTRVARGWLYSEVRGEKHPQIKFPDVFMKACLSFDFSPLENGRNKAKYPLCDTIMFGYYLGEQLKVVKYFRDDRVRQGHVEDDYVDCMIVGSWERTDSSAATIQGAFYTTDFDAREEVPGARTVTQIVGRDKGYDSKPQFSFDAPFWKPGTMWRDRYFSQETVITKSEGIELSAGACIPFLCRNAVFYGQRRTVDSEVVTKTGSLESIQDPYSYRYWTYDQVMHWAGNLEVMRGSPYPKNANPVWVEIENYAPSQCSDFADSGPWVSGLPADYTWLIHPIANEWLLQGGGGAPPYKAYNTTTPPVSKTAGKHEISILSEPGQVASNPPDNDFFMPSPTESGFLYYADATRNLFGATVYANVNFTKPESSARIRWGHSLLADDRSAHFFIGVVNE